MDIEYLAWDSQHFGCNIGRVVANTFNSDEYHQLVSLKKSLHYQRIYLFLKSEADTFTIPGKLLADIKIVFHKTIHLQEKEPSADVHSYSGEATSGLLELAYLSGHQSRFKKDVLLNSGFESLYRLWLERSISHQLADQVFVYQRTNEIEGFVTIKLNNETGTIGLIAVSADQKGKGIGRKLMDGAEQWAVNQGAKALEVATQKYNHNACEFYSRLGYNIKEITYIYHI